MKMNKLFMAALAAITLLASCSKEDNGAGGTDGKAAAMQIKLSYAPDNQTYSLDGPINAGSNTTLGTALLYQMVGDNVFTVTELTATDITAMTGAAGLRIENVNSTVDGVYIVGNAPSGNVAALKALTTKATIEGFAIAVESQQSVAGSTGVTAVTVMGYGAAATATDPTPDGHAYKKATVTAAPVVARMEVAGKVQISIEPDNQIKSITWKKVWFNRYYTAFDKATIKEYTSTDANWNDGTYPTWATDVYSATVDTKEKCYAYQFFPATSADAAKLPAIVMQADVTLKDDRTLTDYYVTIKTFKKGTTALDQMLANKIYKVDLNNLTVDHTDFTPEPNPEQVDLGISVEITPWTVENITPVI